MGGKNIPLLQHQIIFDCLASYSDFKAAKKAMLAARPGAPAHARICFFHHHRITAALIRVDPLDPHYLLGGWHLPNPLIPHPSFPGARLMSLLIEKEIRSRCRKIL